MRNALGELTWCRAGLPALHDYQLNDFRQQDQDPIAECEIVAVADKRIYIAPNGKFDSQKSTSSPATVQLQAYAGLIGQSKTSPLLGAMGS